jgi:hypothetical protein
MKRASCCRELRSSNLRHNAGSRSQMATDEDDQSGREHVNMTVRMRRWARLAT